MNALQGKRVAFTGKLASMTRSEAANLIRAHGGVFVLSVSRKTSLLVVGQEGWPLRQDGRLTDKLETAKHLQTLGCKIAIVDEEELLRRLGLAGDSNGIHKRFTLPQLGTLLKIPRDRLRSWMRAGLVQPVEETQGVCYFDFHQVTGLRTLWDLTQAGVGTEVIRRSLEQLSQWSPRLGAGLDQLNLLEREGRLVVRLDQGQLAEPSGQLNLDFEGGSTEPVARASPATRTSTEWWEQGCAYEDAGQLREAAEAYREALYLSGPDAKICFNLANVLYALGHLGQAAERFRQAVELEHEFAEAWNNLGNVLFELGQTEDALKAYRSAIAASPDYADAHYNLADLLDTVSGPREARKHWKEYLRLEPVGEWAEYARERLANWRGRA